MYSQYNYKSTYEAYVQKLSEEYQAARSTSEQITQAFRYISNGIKELLQRSNDAMSLNLPNGSVQPGPS